MLALVVLAVWAVPVFAADGSGATPPAAQGAQGWHKLKILGRLLLIQDEVKVDAFIAKAVEADKLTAEQALTVKEVWTERHEQFARRFGRNQILGRLLTANDQTKVQAALDKAVAAGKMQQAQADKIINAWLILHTP